MPYYTGLANSLEDIRGALVTSMTQNGWVDDQGVLIKGGSYVKLTIGQEDAAVPGTRLIVSVGNSAQDGELIDSPLSPRVGPLEGSGQYDTWDWPVQYHVQVHESEVYLSINYNGVWWQHLAFGRSPSPGNPGTGNWLFATFPHPGRSKMNATTDMSPDGGSLSTYRSINFCPLPFFWTGSKDNSYRPLYMNAQIHGCINPSDNVVWSDREEPGVYSNFGVTSGITLSPLLAHQPNAWNGEAALLPIQIFQTRVENKVSLVGELRESRFTRNDYLPDGEVVTLGQERWKIYPAYRRNTASRNGGQSSHSGTFALAIRYDGP